MKITINTRVKTFLKEYAFKNKLRGVEKSLEHFLISQKKIEPAPVRKPSVSRDFVKESNAKRQKTDIEMRKERLAAEQIKLKKEEKTIANIEKFEKDQVALMEKSKNDYDEYKKKKAGEKKKVVSDKTDTNKAPVKEGK